MNPLTQLATALSKAHINSCVESTPNVDEMSSPGFSKRKKKRLNEESTVTPVKRSNWIDDINSLDEAAAEKNATATEDCDSLEKVKRKRIRKRKNKSQITPPPAPMPRKEIALFKATNPSPSQNKFKKPNAEHVR